MALSLAKNHYHLPFDHMARKLPKLVPVISHA